MRLRMELDAELAELVSRSAKAERRPITWQAEVLLRRALGLSTGCTCERGDQRPAEPDRRQEVPAC